MGKGILIAEGNTAQVYAWGEKEILKLFRSGFYQGAIEKEYYLSKKIEKLGLPVPKVGGMIEEDGRTGITFEKITGSSMLHVLEKKPWKAKKYAKLLAEIQYKIHRTKIEDEHILSYKEALERNILHTDLLSEDKKQDILNILKRLPDGASLCHGDFHPGNVLMNHDKTVVLDWMTAASGAPAADVARSLALIKDAALPPKTPKPVQFMIQLLRRHLASVYLKHYIKISGVTEEEINDWRIPIIAARLIEFIPENDRNNTLNEIHQSLSYSRLKVF